MNTSVHQSSEIHPFVFNDIEIAVVVHSLDIEHYQHEEIYARNDDIFIQNNSLRDISKAHYLALAESFRNYDFDYACVMMTVYFLSTVSSEGATSATGVHIVDGMTVLKTAISW